MKEFFYAVALSALACFLTSDARAQKLSEHDNLESAIRAAQEAILAEGCALTWPEQIKRYHVIKATDGIKITAMGYHLKCEAHIHKLRVSWEAIAQAVSYQIYVGTTADDLTEVASVPADQLEAVITVDKAMVFVVITSTSAEGIKSDYTPVARIEYVPQ